MNCVVSKRFIMFLLSQGVKKSGKCIRSNVRVNSRETAKIVVIQRYINIKYIPLGRGTKECERHGYFFTISLFLVFKIMNIYITLNKIYMCVYIYILILKILKSL